MIYLKRLVALFLCYAVCFSFASCASNDGNLTDTTSESVSSYDSFESSVADEESIEISVDDLTSDDEASEDISEEISAEESSEDIVIDRFSVLSPQVDFNKVWENAGMELYNTEFRMSEELCNKFASRFASFANAQSVALIELETNMAFCFSKDTKIGTASAIKAPLALFVSKCIDDGLISWDDVKTYQWWHYQANSTGWVQKSPYGTAFSIKTLMDYMIRISDNQAYLMLKELVGAEEFEQMMAGLGSSRIIPKGGNWGDITAWEMASAWREIYYYSKYNENGAELLDRFMHAQYNYIWQAIPQYECAHKSGWSGKAFNDAGIVYADGREYVIVVLMGRSGIEDQRSHYQFNYVTWLLADLMVEYNAYLDGASDTENSEESVG